MAIEQGPRHRYRSYFWPVLLIGVGVVWLLVNLGLVAPSSIAGILQLWPLLLIVLGLDMIFGRGSPVIGLLLGLLLVGAVVGLLVLGPRVGINPTPQLATETFTEPVNGAQSASVKLDLSLFQTEVSALAGGQNLFEANVEHLGDMVFTTSGAANRVIALRQELGPNSWMGPTFLLERNVVWKIGLNPDVPTALEVNSASGAVTLDLSQNQLSGLNLDSGSGSVKLRLPDDSRDYQALINSGSGSISADVGCGGKVELSLDGGSGSRNIQLNSGCPLRVEVRDTGSGSINLPDGLTRVSSGSDGEGVWESADYAGSDHGVLIIVDSQGSGSLNVH